MLPYLVFGLTYGFACAVQPGPFQAYLVSLALAHGWRRALPAALAPLLSDGPIALAALFVLSHLPGRALQGLRLAGGAFLLYLAYGAYRSWRDAREAASRDAGSPARNLFQAAVVNLLNPNPYLGWSLVMGPLLLKGWREAPASGIALVVSFYATIVLAQAGIVMLSAGARKIGPKASRPLVGASAVALAAFGIYQLWTGAAALWIRG
jgi:threonine/homoserine/homoserine lactone efflux protein